MGFEHRPIEERDRIVVELLRRAGDAPLCLRNVQHRARFETEPSARLFAAALDSAGYFMELREDSIHESGQGQWVVEFASMQAADLTTVQRHTKKLQELSKKHTGSYLGWATQPVRVRKPSF